MVSVYSFVFNHLGRDVRCKPNFGPRAAVLPLLVFSLALAACSDGGGDGNLLTVDQSAQVPARSWTVAVTNPDPTCVQSDKELPLEVIAYDSAGNAIANPPYTVTSSAPGALEILGGLWTVRGEGPARITVSYTGASTSDADIAPVGLDLTRDGTAPAIVIDSPARGVMLTTATPTDAITITGSVEDALTGISGIMVNGEPLDIAGTSLQEAIDVQRAANWGTNVITVQATDRCLNVARHSQSFLQSTSYLQPATSPVAGARADGALVLSLTQEALDDRNRLDTDDLTTLIQGALNSEIPAMLRTMNGMVLHSSSVLNCTYTAAVAGTASIGPVRLNTALGAGFTDHVINSSNIVIPVRYRQLCTWGPFPDTTLQAVFTHRFAGFSNTSQLAYRVNSVGLPAVIVQSSSTRLSNPVVGGGNAAVEEVVSFLFSIVNGIITEIIGAIAQPLITDILQQLASPFIADLARAAVLPIPFPPPFDLTLNVEADWDGISVSAGAMVQTLGQYITPNTVGTAHPAAEGAISAAVPPRGLGAATEPVTLALSDDGINQMLWAFWYGGGLELPDLAAYAATLPGNEADLGGVSLGLSGMLPPVLMPGAGSGGIVLGLGDLRFEGSIDLAQNASLPGIGVVAVTGYAALLLHAAPAYDITGNTLVLQGGAAGDRFHLQIETMTVDGLPVPDAALREAVIQLIEDLAPQAMRGILEELAGKVNLPPLDLPLPPEVFGPGRALILDIVQVRRDGDRFVVSIDPDDPLQVIPNLSSADWAAFSLVALDAARLEAGLWLDGAKISCRVFQNFAATRFQNLAGTRVDGLSSSYSMTAGLKDALTTAGAPDIVARNWNRALKSAWDQWSRGVKIPSLPWYPEFLDDVLISVARVSAGNIPTPLGDLTFPGRAAMSRESLKARLLVYLDDGGRQAGVIAFADDLGARMDEQLLNSLVQNVPASVEYYPFNYSLFNPLTWFPLYGPLQGTCEGGDISPNYFSLP